MILFLWLALTLFFGAVLYVYAGFPVCLWLLQLRRQYRPPRSLDDCELPTVTMLTAAYNEESVIRQKLDNCLGIDYPEHKLQFVFVSDSTDGTNQILRQAASDRLVVVLLENRRGKVAALSAAYPAATGEIFVFSDANTYYQPDSIRKLVRHFQCPNVGLVTGDVRILPTAKAFGTGERLYYQYERWLQRLETSFGSTVAIDGAMYALRKTLHRPASHGLIADDLVTGMNVGCQGYRIIYDPESIAEENPTPTDGQEFRRKVRVVAYAIQSLLEGEGVPPLAEWRLLWVYASHKVLRWLVPVFLCFALLDTAVLASQSRFAANLLITELTFYALALISWQFPRLNSLVFRVPYYFTMVNTAALIGILRGLRKRQKATWNRTDRIASRF